MGDKILVDSDAFVGWIVATDAHHERATAAFERLKNDRVQLATTNLVIAETASLLSRRNSQPQAKAFLNVSQQIEIICITPTFHQLTVKLFLQQERNSVSFVDLANVVVSQEYNIGEIVSFDKVYSKIFGLKIAA